MRITLTIDATDNAAFDGNEGPEVARIVRAAADRLGEWVSLSPDSFPLRDANGNTVGRVEITREARQDLPTLIALDTDPERAPGCYLICLVTNPEAGPGHYDWNERDESNTRLIQTDTDWPSVAAAFGMANADNADLDTVEEFLDKCVSECRVVGDPGYFDA